MENNDAKNTHQMKKKGSNKSCSKLNFVYIKSSRVHETLRISLHKCIVLFSERLVNYFTILIGQADSSGFKTRLLYRQGSLDS